MIGWTRIEDIEAALIAAIGSPEGINGVVLGNELLSGVMRPPYLMLIPEDSTIDPDRLGVRETVFLKYTLAVIDDPYSSESATRSKSLVLGVAASLLNDHTLGELVQDVVRTGWVPQFSRRESNDGSPPLQGAAVRVEIRLIV